MKLFWCAQTRASRLVWMLEEVGIDYERVTIDLRDPESRNNPEFLAASPMGKVPALQDGDVAMAESAAMCLYLADRYASGRLAPPIDVDERGTFLYWMFYGAAVMEPAMSEQASGAETNKGQRGWGDFETMLRVLTERLTGREWLLDSGFSAADVSCGSTAYFLRLFNMLPEDASVISDYIDRCLARPAYVKALAAEQS
ncbi:MAG: glutathione S-transferase family protein [Gammaproteobacteria bacterium]